MPLLRQINQSLKKSIAFQETLYFSYFVICISIGIACASWIFLVYAIVYIILQHILVIPEERFCIEKYGDVYREYMNKVPRWIGIPKGCDKKNKNQKKEEKQ